MGLRRGSKTTSQFQAWQAMSSFPVHVRMGKLLRRKASPPPPSSSGLDRVDYPSDICEVKREDVGAHNRKILNSLRNRVHCESTWYPVVSAARHTECSLSNALLCRAAQSLTSPSAYLPSCPTLRFFSFKVQWNEQLNCKEIYIVAIFRLRI